MDEQAPASLDSKLFLAHLHRRRSYPLLRAVRWLIRFAVLASLLVGLLLAVILVSEGVSSDTREIIVSFGGPARGSGVFAGLSLLIGVAVRAFPMLALSEAIQLLLDLRETQLETSRAPSA